jgi:hypothetical protein
VITGLEKRNDEVLALTDPLAHWIVNRIEPWERYRDNEYKAKWGEYYRIWRGQWAARDKDRQVERSRIITPATQQAVESQVAEMEQSIFARKRWFDLDGFDPFPDPDANREAAEIILDFLQEDLDHADVQTVVTEALLNGALYGTGIVKILVEKIKERTPNAAGGIDLEDRIQVSLAAVDPMNFLIEPAATSIDDSIGVAHVYVVPKHHVLRKQEQGIYEKGEIGSFDGSLYDVERMEGRSPEDDQATELIEYHGLVPAELMDRKNPDDILEFARIKPVHEKGDFVEVVGIIANRTKRLRISENPYIMRDRGFAAFQFDTVPNRFHGRGVVEKAYNAQKALDTEVRARIDALSLSTYPMTLVNTLMAPRSMNSTVSPGKRLAVNGNPNEAVSVLKLPGPDANSYRHANDLERMVQSATGAVSPNSPLGINPTNETASGMSMMLGSMFKRSKRTLRNIEEQLLRPMVTKTIWRYMQFAPRRYPFADYRFVVHSGLGASAREFEVAQLAQFLQTMEPGGPEYWIILRAMLENFSLDAKDELLGLVQARVEASMQPQEPVPTLEQQLKSRELDLKETELQFKIQEAQAELAIKQRQVEAEAVRDESEGKWSAATAETERLKGGAEAEKLMAETQERKAAAILNLAKARDQLSGRLAQ